MKGCNPDGPVMVQVSKLYHTTDAQSFRAFGRVISGTLRKGVDIKVLGEGYSPEDEEDMMKATVDDLWISESRFVKQCLVRMTAANAKLVISFQRTKFPLATSFSLAA